MGKASPIELSYRIHIKWQAIKQRKCQWPCTLQTGTTSDNSYQRAVFTDKWGSFLSLKGPPFVSIIEVITVLGSDYPTPTQSVSLPPAGLKTVGSAKDTLSDNTGQSPGERETEWLTDFVLNSIHPLLSLKTTQTLYFRKTSVQYKWGVYGIHIIQKPSILRVDMLTK